MWTAEEEKLLALMGYTQDQLATVLTLIIGIAAERHPEELKAALAKVFSLKCVEETTRQMKATLSELLEQTRKARGELHDINREIRAAERRVEAVAYEAERLVRERQRCG